METLAMMLAATRLPRFSVIAGSRNVGLSGTKELPPGGLYQSATEASKGEHKTHVAKQHLKHSEPKQAKLPPKGLLRILWPHVLRPASCKAGELKEVLSKEQFGALLAVVHTRES